MQQFPNYYHYNYSFLRLKNKPFGVKIISWAHERYEESCFNLEKIFELPRLGNGNTVKCSYLKHDKVVYSTSIRKRIATFLILKSCFAPFWNVIVCQADISTMPLPPSLVLSALPITRVHIRKRPNTDYNKTMKRCTFLFFIELYYEIF